MRLISYWLVSCSCVCLSLWVRLLLWSSVGIRCLVILLLSSLGFWFNSRIRIFLILLIRRSRIRSTNLITSLLIPLRISSTHKLLINLFLLLLLINLFLFGVRQEIGAFLGLQRPEILAHIDPPAFLFEFYLVQLYPDTFDSHCFESTRCIEPYLESGNVLHSLCLEFFCPLTT